ncbi:DUF2075 domain-containing protein [Alloscardovia theropitheci]|uniref:DUF2075 domain-containing protein n=1 Tax=Alloscardovia theropitheci TaxID=2496842 RepID=A0A4R0QUE8_9BIFI|nr:DUF2075 domain-containing protein [Alloscardovia theropitheci]TCD55025.1 DUF2075 domain-containing protein [Alloscardovia theropitheci]
MVSSPIIYSGPYDSIDDGHLVVIPQEKKPFILNYPTVYIIHHTDGKNYVVYVGETSDIRRRTEEHLNSDPRYRDDWDELAQADDAEMYVIGHDHFNKSLTLDIENKFIHYLSSVENVSVNNRRFNDQNEYYTSDLLEPIFSKTWNKLHTLNKNIFPAKTRVEDSAIFKASPFHKLTEEQVRAKNLILDRVADSLTKERTGQLILVNGEAGSGKTVLMSTLFYELFEESKEEDSNLSGVKVHLLVNHKEQITVYEEIARKLGIYGKNKEGNKIELVSKPTSFINSHDPDIPEEIADVVIVDEAHLLLTQGRQSYRGKNQLEDLLKRAKIVVAVFDEKQILTTEEYWEKDALDRYIDLAKSHHNYITLSQQMRINSDRETIAWIRNVIDNQRLDKIPNDSHDYEIKVFDTPAAMYDAIKNKNDSIDQGLSRMVATFDWEYKAKRKDGVYSYVTIGDWTMPWNLQLPKVNDRSMDYHALSWAEQPQTIDEVGSTFTIQGFDLNYVGVIIGPSVVYRNGRIQFRPEYSKNDKATRNRTLSDGSKKKFGEELLKNELNVLLTRGVKGLYLYAVDEQLQQELLRLYKEKMNDKR